MLMDQDEKKGRYGWVIHNVLSRTAMPLVDLGGHSRSARLAEIKH